MSLAEADFDHRTFQNVNSEDARLYVRFYDGTVEDATASKAAGRPIFKDVPYIMIQAPGDLLKTIKRPVRDQDKQRFPLHWQAYASRASQDNVAGTPLALSGLLTPAQLEEYAHARVTTVEQLANMADNLVQKFLGATSLKQRAREFLEYNEKTGGMVRLRKQNEEQALEIAELKDAVAKLSAQIRAPAPQTPAPQQRSR